MSTSRAHVTPRPLSLSLPALVPALRKTSAAFFLGLLTCALSTTSAIAETTVAPNPFPLLRGQNGNFTATIFLTPPNSGEKRVGLLTGTMTNTGAVSATLLSNGRTYRLNGRFDANRQLTLKLPSNFVETQAVLKVVWPDSSLPPKLTVTVGNTETQVAKGGGYVTSSVGLAYGAAYQTTDGASGYLSVLTTSKAARLLITGSLPNGVPFSGSTILHEDPTSTSPDTAPPIAELLVPVKDDANVFTKLTLNPSNLSGFSAWAPQVIPVGSHSLVWALCETQPSGYNRIIKPSSGRELVDPSSYSTEWPNWYGLIFNPDSTTPIVTAIFRVEGMRFTSTTSLFSETGGRIRLSLDPKTGIFSGVVSVPETDPNTSVVSLTPRKFTGMFFGPNGGVGVTPEGIPIVIRRKHITDPASQTLGVSISLGGSISTGINTNTSGATLTISGNTSLNNSPLIFGGTVSLPNSDSGNTSQNSGSSGLVLTRTVSLNENGSTLTSSGTLSTTGGTLTSSNSNLPLSGSNTLSGTITIPNINSGLPTLTAGTINLNGSIPNIGTPLLQSGTIFGSLAP